MYKTKPPIQILKDWIIKRFSNAVDSLITIILTLIFAGGIYGIIAFYKSLLLYAKTTFLFPIPLWTAIVLSAAIYLYFHTRTKDNHASQKTIIKTELYPIKKLRWKIEYFSKKDYKVYPTPYCHMHNMQLYNDHNVFSCPSENRQECMTVFIKEDRIIYQYKKALSIIEHKIKNFANNKVK